MTTSRAPGPLPRKVLVTGGAGFVGRSTVERLVAAGGEVSVVDIRPYPGTGATITVGDIRDPEVIERVLPAAGGPQAVVHLAALTSVLRSVEDPAEVFRTNVAATAALLERCRLTGVGAFVLASTGAAVGQAPRGPASQPVSSPPIAPSPPLDEDTPLHPLTPYGATKAAGEMLLSAYAASYGIAGSALRFTNIYGPGMQAKDTMVPRIVRAALSGRPVTVYGDGRQVRDYLHVIDAVAAIELALALPGGVGTMFAGSGMSTSVLDLVEAARRVTGVPVPVEHVAQPEGEMREVRVDISLARRLGWEPQVGLDEGLSSVWEDLRANPGP